jgi:hypothetical protein
MHRWRVEEKRGLPFAMISKMVYREKVGRHVAVTAVD